MGGLYIATYLKTNVFCSTDAPCTKIKVIYVANKCIYTNTDVRSNWLENNIYYLFRAFH